MVNYREEFYDDEVHRVRVSLLRASIPFPDEEVLKLLNDIKQEIIRFILTKGKKVPMQSVCVTSPAVATTLSYMSLLHTLKAGILKAFYNVQSQSDFNPSNRKVDNRGIKFWSIPAMTV